MISFKDCEMTAEESHLVLTFQIQLNALKIHFISSHRSDEVFIQANSIVATADYNALTGFGHLSMHSDALRSQIIVNQEDVVIMQNNKLCLHLTPTRCLSFLSETTDIEIVSNPMDAISQLTDDFVLDSSASVHWEVSVSLATVNLWMNARLSLDQDVHDDRWKRLRTANCCPRIQGGWRLLMNSSVFSCDTLAKSHREFRLSANFGALSAFSRQDTEAWQMEVLSLNCDIEENVEVCYARIGDRMHATLKCPQVQIGEM